MAKVNSTDDQKVERFEPNPLVQDQVNRILAQNERILEMNARLLDVICRPTFVISNHVSMFDENEILKHKIAQDRDGRL